MIRVGYHDIEPLGGFEDRGRDAIHICKATGRVTIFAYSVREDWDNKLKEDLKRIEQNSHDCDTVVFVTTGEPTPTQKASWIGKVQSTYGWKLEFYDLERIGTLIDGPHSDLKRLHPNIFVLDATREPLFEEKKRNWTRVVGYTQRTSMDGWPKPWDRDKIMRLVTSMNLRFLVQATVEVFSAKAGIETTVLYSSFCEADSVRTEIISHRAELLRAIQRFSESYKTKEDEYWKSWERFKSEWPNIKETRLPLNVKCFPLGIVFNRDARLVSFRTDLMNGLIRVPRTTDDFLTILGTLANLDLAALDQLAPPAHPLNKLLCYVMDKSSVDLDRLRVNADNIDEFDYVYEQYDEETSSETKNNQP
jgi:hypothetical protein